MKLEKEYIELLIASKPLSSNEQIIEYEAAVKALFVKDDARSIGNLFNGFLDATEDEEVMFGTLHAIEYFSKSLGIVEYLQIVLPYLKKLKNDAYGWAETFLLRILNNDDSYNELIQIFEKLRVEDQIFLKELAQGLVRRKPEKFGVKGNIIVNM